MEQIKELQMQVEEEQRNREEFRENYLSAEKRLAIVQAEKEDIMLSSQQVAFLSNLLTKTTILSTVSSF